MVILNRREAREHGVIMTVVLPTGQPVPRNFLGSVHVATVSCRTYSNCSCFATTKFELRSCSHSFIRTDEIAVWLTRGEVAWTANENPSDGQLTAIAKGGANAGFDSRLSAHRCWTGVRREQGASSRERCRLNPRTRTLLVLHCLKHKHSQFHSKKRPLTLSIPRFTEGCSRYYPGGAHFFADPPPPWHTWSQSPPTLRTSKCFN